jgi:hypothetical protein
MSCRICFESQEPLYSPCRCDGSIKYIHEECLLKWVLVTNRSACELCKERYTFDYNQPLEKDILIDPLRHYFLVNPSWHIAAFCSCVIIIQQYFQLVPTTTLFITVQLVYHNIYMSLWYVYCKKTIYQWPRYMYEIKRGYGSVILLLHGILLSVLLILSLLTSLTSLVFLCIANQCYLGVYPILHSTIVYKMNQSRTIVIQNRCP